MGVLTIVFIVWCLTFASAATTNTTTDNNIANNVVVLPLADTTDYIFTGVFLTSTQQAVVATAKPPVSFLQLGGFTDTSCTVQKTQYAPDTFTAFTGAQGSTAVDESVSPPMMYLPTNKGFLRVRLSASTNYTYTYAEFPNLFSTFTSNVIVNKTIYLSGSSPRSPVRLLRVPTSNFTVQSTTEPTNLISFPNQEMSVAAGATDGTYIYYSNGNRTAALVYRFNPKTFSFDDIIGQLSIGDVVGAFADAVRQVVYFYNEVSVVKFSTANFTQVGYLRFNKYATDASSVVVDLKGGHAYFSHYTSPGMITHLNLRTFTLAENFTMATGQQQLGGGMINAAQRRAYFFGATPGSIIGVKLPYACLNNCSIASGQGLSCDFGVCTCASNFTGEDCSQRRCIADCSGNGNCNDGTCACFPQWTGAICTVRQCPNNCLGRGICDTTTFTCDCGENWSGDDCSKAPPVPACEKLTSCSECFRNVSCGWCETSSKCMYGDSFGPFAVGTCESWSYGDCPSLFYTAIGWLFSAFAFILLLVSFILTFIQDLTIPDNTKTKEFVVRFWWRNQLSAKAWHLVDRIQLAAITGYFAVNPPAIYSNFVGAFRWSILNFALPWSRPDTVRPSRELLDFEQDARIIDANFDEIFLGNVFWLIIIIAAAIVLFVVLFLLSLCMGKNMRNLAQTRIIYSPIRLLLFGYLGICCTAFYTLIYYNTAENRRPDAVKGLGIAVATLIVVVIGLPLFAFAILFNKKKELFIIHFSMKFGCLFQSFHFKKSYFTTVQLCKKLLIGLFVGVIYTSATPQLVLIMIVHAAYFVGLIVLKPYIDQVHFFVDLVVTFLDIIMVGLLFGFASPTHTVGCAIAAVVLHVIAFIVLIAGFINSTLKMSQINSFGDLGRALTGGK